MTLDAEERSDPLDIFFDERERNMKLVLDFFEQEMLVMSLMARDKIERGFELLVGGKAVFMASESTSPLEKDRLGLLQSFLRFGIGADIFFFKKSGA